MKVTQPTHISNDTYRTIYALLEENASRFPNKPFIQSIDQKKEITYGQAYLVCNQIGHFCKQKEIKANDRIVLLGDNSLEYLMIFLGVLAYGATFCPINLETNEKIIRELIEKIQPKTVLWDDSVASMNLETDAPGEWISIGEWSVAGEGKSENTGFFATLKGYPDTPTGAPVCTEDDFSLIIHTSGTTDKPKGVIMTYASFYYSSEATADMIGVTPEDRILEYRPFSWGSAQSLALGAPLYVGATAVIAKKFSRSRFFDWLKDYRVTIAVGVPAAINMLLAQQVDISKSELPDLKFMTSSTAPLSEEQHLKFEKVYGIKIIQLYGMSEAGWIAANHPDNRKIGSVGRPVKYQEIRILDEDGRPCPPGTIGEVEVGGRQRHYGYLEQAGVVVPFGDARLKTGDVGFLDQEGFLHITGRKKDLIIRGGINIAPLEIDNVLLQFPGVAEAATIGAPSPIYGEEVVCYVACKPGKSLTVESLLEHCRIKLPDIKVPREIVFVDAIPKTERGKVNRNYLLEEWKRTHSAR
jgi:acyl-coenzyme A synthetase/AMP-(fatty) acid ligase